MELTAPTSIFRCMPNILPPGYRRLLGSFAYLVDGAELSFDRLRQAALEYELPMPETGWPARNRIAMFVDSWTLVDHAARVRKLVSRFPWQDKSSVELNDFIRDTRPATQVRNRLTQLDDESHAGSASAESQAILGTLSWVDMRNPGRHTRYAISSGPCTQAEALVETPAGRLAEGSTVGQFRLQVADEDVDLDSLHLTMCQFATRLEDAMAKSVREALAAEAINRNIPVGQLGASGSFDLTAAMTFEADGPGAGTVKAGQRHSASEVLPDTFDQGC